MAISVQQQTVRVKTGGNMQVSTGLDPTAGVIYMRQIIKYAYRCRYNTERLYSGEIRRWTSFTHSFLEAFHDHLVCSHLVPVVGPTILVFFWRETHRLELSIT